METNNEYKVVTPKKFADYTVSQRMLIVLGIAVTAIVVLSFIFSKVESNVKSDYLTHKKKTVEYKITGRYGWASLTYTNSQGGTSQIAEVKLPYTVELGKMNSDDYVYISAQNTIDRGDINVQILIDGSVYKESSSSGGYTIATASGKIP